MEFDPLSLDIVWVLVAAVFVFLMQAGFAMVEAGATRAKNAANIIMKNVMDMSMGSLFFWAVGFGLMFGANESGWIGTDNFFLSNIAPSDGLTGMFDYVFFVFQLMFAATAATIVSGAVAERTKFGAYLIYSAFVTAIIYPIFGSWVWNGDGWLFNLGDYGFMDFAGSTVVHSVGGWAALAGAIVVGPRLGKFVDGKPRALPGHSITLVALGVFILWFGWFGFNPGSTVAAGSGQIAIIALTTTMAAAAGGIAAMGVGYAMWKHYDASLSLNGIIGGLVAITAGCAAVSPGSSIIIGAIGGAVVVGGVLLLERVLKIDDPVGAISVHGFAGVWGTLAVGLFADSAFSGGADGLFFGGGVTQLGVQFVGVFAAFAFVFPASFILFKAIDMTIGMRASDEDQIRGLDISEHAAAGYPDFAPSDMAVGTLRSAPTGGADGAPMPEPSVAQAEKLTD
jgi:Amt family ammonium transporter